MKFTYQWLNEYCECKLPPEELADLITKHGVKVESYEKFGDDTVFELEITANRPDLLSVIGVAREIALLTGKPLRIPSVKEDEKTAKAKNLVEIEDSDLCPLYIGRVIKGIKVSASPDWMRKRLEAIGLRPVNNIVDITNYVLYETGQPLHTFDLDKLAEKRVIVRRARAGEKIKAIDDKDYSLSSEMLVIADAKTPMAIAGVMGGKSSEISYGTNDILLESAVFTPANTRKVSRQLKLSSDSSYRFERSVDSQCVNAASLRAVALIKELAGGKVTLAQEVNFVKSKPKKAVLRLSRCEDILSLSVDKAEIKRILKGLGFVTKKEYKGIIELVVPSFRPDVNAEIDIIEEIIRIVGYDYIPIMAPSITPAVRDANKIDLISEKIKNILSGLGYNEVLTDSFVDNKYLDDFPLWSKEKGLGLLNTDGVEDKFLRKSIIPELLHIQKTNQGFSDAGDKIKVFEISQNYRSVNGQPSEKVFLAMLDTQGFYSLKGTLAAIFERLKINDAVFIPENIQCFTPFQSVVIKVKDNIIGWMGEVNGALIDKYELRVKSVAAELDFEKLAEIAITDKVTRGFSRFPAIKRDLAMIFDVKTEWKDIQSVVYRDIPDFLETLEFFDLYKGKNIPVGKKSIAFSLVFRSKQKTLTNEEIDKVVEAVIQRLTKQFGAALR